MSGSPQLPQKDELSFAPRACVLLIDDQDDYWAWLKTALEHPSVEVVRARSIDEAIAQNPQGEFAVALIGPGLQGGQGLAAARALRTGDAFRRTPILLLTDDLEERPVNLSTADLGAIEYLRKPLDFESLPAKVGQLLNAYWKNRRLQQQVEQSRLQELRGLNQRLAEETARLRESEARKAAILESSLDAIIIVDSDAVVVEFNPAAERTFGFSREEAVGRALPELIIPGSKREQFVRGFSRVAADGQATLLNRRIEMPALRADGAEIIVELAITQVANCQPVMFTAFLRDITLQKRHEKQRAARLAVIQILLEAPSLSDAAPRILRAVCENLQWDVGAIWQLDASRLALRCVEIWYGPHLQIPEFVADSLQRSFSLGEGLPGRIWATGKPAWIPDVVTDANFPRAPIAHREGLHGAFGFPIMLGNEFLGVIEFFSHSIQMPDADKFEMAVTIGSHLAQFIDRKRTETKVRNVTNELQTVTNGITIPVTRCNRDCQYMWVSQPYADWIGRPVEQIVGRSIRDVLGDAAFNQLWPRFEQVLGGEPVEYEEEVAFGNIGRRFIQATYTPTRNANGEIDGWVAVVIDITARKEVEQALRQSEQRFSRFMEQLPGLAWIKDLSGRYIYANAATMKAFGHTAETMFGKTDSELFPTKTAQQFIDNDRQALASETGLQLIESLQHPDGSVHYSLVNKFPVRDAKGTMGFVGGMAIDITDRMRAEESLRDADRRKDNFLATLAHELRNPLAPLCTGLELLRNTPADSEQFTLTREVMERQLKHMVRLIDDLMDVARIAKGKLHLHRDDVELAPIVRDAIETSRPLIDSQGHKFTVTLPTETVLLRADKTRLAQVISNLLNNAAKYTDPNGRIELIIERDGEEVVLIVRDSGIGIAPSDLPIVFDSFAQVDPTARSRGGLGVGLGLVRAVVELHGGRVSVFSQGIGKGSEFTVRLPVLAQIATAAPLTRDERTTAAAKPRKVLVVDDNRDAANSLSMVLRVLGHNIETAYDGISAIKLASNFRPDVVLLDIGMPHMNGYQVVEQFRQQAWGQKAILIAVSGWGQEADKLRALEAGFNGHLTKPVHAADVEALFQRQLDEAND